MVINCKLNDKFHASLKQGEKLIKFVKETRNAGTWHELTISSLIYSTGDTNIVLSNNIRNTKFKRLICCGIDEAIFSSLGRVYTTSSIWHKDFDVIVAHWMKHHRSRMDKRVFIIGLPVKTKQGSMYNVEFYKRLRKTLLSWGCKELVRRPYKNLNSNNYLSVLVGQF